MLTTLSLRNIAFLCIVLSLFSCASPHRYQADSPLFTLNKDTQSRFEIEKKHVLVQSDKANFKKLRTAFTGTKLYRPWETTEHEAALSMLNASEDENYELCLAFADALIEANFISLDGHYGAFQCNKELGNTARSEFHSYVLKGLLDSIHASGDGLSPDTAYVTLSSNETRAFIRLQGLLMYRQEPLLIGNKQLEHIFIIEPISDEASSLYFDISAATMSVFKQGISAPTLN